MATYAYVAYKLTIAPSRDPDKLSRLSDINGGGENLLHLAHGFLQNVSKSPLTDERTKQYLAVTAVQPAGQTLHFTGRYGHYGQSGANVIDVDTGESLHEFGDNDAFTSEMRNLLVVPDHSTVAFLLAERQSGRGLATMFMRHLAKAFKQRFASDKLILRSEGLTNGEAWRTFLANAQLTKVRVIRHRVSSDIADEPESKQFYNLAYSSTPARGYKYFPRKVADGLLDRTIKAQEILGLSEDLEIDETRLEMTGEDWQKEFSLDQDTPVLIYPVHAAGDSRPSDKHMYDRMEGTVTELCPTLGVDLPSGWQNGTWPQEALAVNLEVFDDS